MEEMINNEYFIRNNIVMVKENNKSKEAIYASFPFEDEEEHDHILLENIKRIILRPENAEVLFKFESDIDLNNKIDYTFDINYKNKKEVILTAKLYDKEVNITLETQFLIDEFIRSIYEHTSLDEKLINYKNILLQSLAKMVYNDNIIFLNEEYNKVCKIYLDDKVIGIANKFIFNKNEKSNEYYLQLSEVASYISIKNLKNIIIEVPLNNKAVIIDKYMIVDHMEGMLKRYRFAIDDNFRIIDKKDGFIPAVENSDILDTEQIFDILSVHLTEKEKILLNNEKKEIKNMFLDVFDFD